MNTRQGTRSRFHALLTRAFLGWLVATCVVVVALPPALGMSDVQARKKKKKKKGRGGGSGGGGGATRAQIREGGGLDPKRNVNLDEDISQTKDLKPTGAEADGPSLAFPDLRQSTDEQLLDEKLDEELKLASELLNFERDCEGIAPVRYRLANLNWEKAKRAFFKSNDFNISADNRKKFTAVMKQLQNRTVQHYEQIVDQCEGWTDYPKVLFNLGKTLVEIERAREGAQYFKRIIKEYPDNEEWVAQAWFMVGEYYFNEENNARQAFRAYERAAEFVNSPIYGFAVYKQGWCHINTGDWDLALAAFDKVVTISEDPAQGFDEKGRISLRKEALKDYVRAYSHVGSAKVAFKTFHQLGGKDAVAGMMENLGNWYISRDAHDDVITVYRDLIKTFKNSTRKPIFQGRIVNASDKLGDDDATIKQVKLLTQYFEEVRKRLKGKVSNEEKETINKDLAEAEDIAENTLRRLALERHKSAKKLPEGSKAQIRLYKVAYELYKHYLDVFPEPKPGATVNYVFFMRYYFAEVLFYMEKFLEAARNYDMVVAMNPEPTDEREKKIILQAAEDAVRSYDELVKDLERRDGVPEVSGNDPKPIPQIKQDLISACLRYIKYVGSEGDKIVEIRYKMARIYYTYNHFDRAAPAFNDIVENHPGHEVACYAANLALDIHNLAKNYGKLRKLTRAYLKNNELKSSCQKNSSGEDFEKFAKIEADATFLLIKQQLEDQKKYVQCGNAYMDYYRQYGNSGAGQHAIDAVYNAAVCYDLGQRLDKANEVREFLVKTFAKANGKEENALVRDTMYNIAQSYERVVDFKKAAEYLERFAEKYPDDKRTKDAMYNAGLYRSTLRDFEGGRAARGKYLKLYEGDKDAHLVKFAICESLEQEAELMEAKKDGAAQRKWEAAHDCYFDWIKDKDYGKRDPDRLCQAQYRRGEIMRTKTKYAKGFAEQQQYLLKNWPAWKKRGTDKVPLCATAISELLFRDIQARYKKYADLRISTINPTKKEQFEKSIQTKVKERDAIIESLKEVAEIGVAETALASLHMIGEAYNNSVESLLKAPIPDKIPGYTLTDEDKTTLRGELEKLAAPIRELAIDAYATCVDTAHRLGVYNNWSMKALARLQQLRPEQYMPVVERLVEVKFQDPLKVASNGVVIKDTAGFKPLELPLKEGIGAPAVNSDQEKSTAEGERGGDDSKARKKDAGDDIPAPVTEARGGRRAKRG